VPPRSTHGAHAVCLLPPPHWCCSKDTNLKVWDTSKPRAWRLLETITGHKAPVLTVKFSPATQRIASAGRDASIKIWDASTLAMDWRARRADDSGITCALLGTCESHGDVIALTWTPDGAHVISGSRDNKVKVWSATTFAEVRDVYDKKLGMGGKHRSDVNRIHVLADSSGMAANGAPVHIIATCSLDGTLRLWRVTIEDGTLKSGAAGAGGAGGGAARGEVDLLGLGASGAGGTGLAVGAGAIGAGGGDPILADTGSGWDEGTRTLLSEILGETTGAQTVTKGAAGLDACLSTLRFFGSDDGIFDMAFNPTMPVVAVGSSANGFALLSFRPDTLPWLMQQYDGLLPPGALPPGVNLDPFIMVQSFYGHTKGVTAVRLLSDDRTALSASTDYTTCLFDVPSLERRLAFTLPASAHALDLGSPVAGAAPFVFVGGADYIVRAYR